MTHESTFEAEDLAALLRAVAWIAEAEAARIATEFPERASSVDVRAEIRQSYGPGTEASRYATVVVLVHRDREGGATHEKTLYGARGPCPLCTASALLSELKREIPRAFVEEKGEEPAPGETFPVGLFGGAVLGNG